MEMAAMTVMGTCLQLAFSLRILCVMCSFELRDTFVFQKLMYQHESGLFDFRRTESSPLLLVIDKRDDPVTPLLSQWTYQAMVHELIGLEDNKVDVRAIGSLSKDQQVEVVLSSEQDAFFKANMYENFGDIGMNIKRLVDDFQQVAKSNKNIQRVVDMARFVDSYPEYKKMQGNVSKHVTLVTEMSKLVEARKLMLVSQTEQDLACNGGQGAAYEAVTDLLNNESVSDIDRLRLVMLYALRYEKENPVQLMQLFNKLASRSPNYKPGLVQFLLKQAGVEKRTGDLFGNRDLMNIARNMARGLKGVENVYTQDQPPVSNNGEHNQREITRCGLTFCWRSFSTRTATRGGDIHGWWNNARGITLCCSSKCHQLWHSVYSRRHRSA